VHSIKLRACALILLAAAAAAGGFISLARTDHPSGRDGYYYLVQMKSLEEEGEMHSPEYSPVYLPLLVLRSITGDYTAAYRMGAVLFKVLFVLSVYSFAKSVVGSARNKAGDRAGWIPLLAAALSAASPSLNYFFTQFPKNMLGFAMFLYFAAAVTATGRRARNDAGRRWRLAAALLLFTVTFFTHRFAAVLSLLFLAIYLVPASARVVGRLFKGGRGYRRLLYSAALAALLLVVILLAAHRLPLAPSIADLQRVTGDLSLSPIFVPASFMEHFGSFRMSLTWRIELFAVPLFCFLSLLMLLLRRKEFTGMGPAYPAVVLVSMTGLFPFLTFSLTGIAYRLLFATLLLWPLVLLPCIGMVLDKLLKPLWAPGAVFLLLAAFSFITNGTYDPEIHDPPWDCYRELAGEIIQALDGEEHELIVAHGALAEMITFAFGEDALPWSPEEEFQRDRVWRVTAGVLGDEISYYLSPEVAETLFIDLRGDYGLLREDAWEDFLQAISDDPVMMHAVDNWRNPMEMRPSYLVGDRVDK